MWVGGVGSHWGGDSEGGQEMRGRDCQRLITPLPQGCTLWRFNRGSKLIDAICQAALLLLQFCEALGGWQGDGRGGGPRVWDKWHGEHPLRCPLSAPGKRVCLEWYRVQWQSFEQRLKGYRDIHTLPTLSWNIGTFCRNRYIYTYICIQTTISTVEHKGLVDREMQAVSFQQEESWETIFSLLGCRGFWERGTKSVFPGVGLKGKYYLPTAAIISSAAVMTAGLERKTYPWGLPHKCKAGSDKGK